MTRHVLMLLSNPYSHDGRVRREVRALVAAGIRVSVVAWDRPGAGPLDERLDGARIVRVASTAGMRRMRFDLLRLRGWWRLAARTALAVAAADPVSSIHAHDQDTLPAGIAVARRLAVPLVYDAHEIWGHMVAKDLPWPLPAWFLRQERRLIRHVDAAIAVSDPVAAHLRAIGGPGLPIHQVLNARPRSVAGPPAMPGPPFTAVYVGSLNPTRLVLETLDAAAGLPQVHVVVAGMGKAAYVDKVVGRARALPNATWLGRIPDDEVLPRTSAAHLVVCLFDPADPLARIGLPNKFFEALACGRPILATRGTFLGDLVAREGVGLAIEPRVDAIRGALSQLAGDPDLVRRLGAKAAEAGRTRFTWEAQAENLVRLHETVVRRAPGA